jgi:metallo-beta-lactamase family protein
MATAITKVFGRQLDLFDDDARRLLAEVRARYGGDFVKFTESVDDSKAITGSHRPCVVIAASGMCENGRILHHLKAGIGDPRNSVAIVGFQAVHTLGRRLVDGMKKVRIFGDEFDVRAEVHTLKAFSAHADRNELIDYVTRVRPKKTFLVHGEQDAREALAEALRSRGLTEVFLPKRGDVVEL